MEEAKDGLDVVTTIDANLQDLVENALLAKVTQKNAKWGCCILMETQTGYIRASLARLPIPPMPQKSQISQRFRIPFAAAEWNSECKGTAFFLFMQELR